MTRPLFEQYKDALRRGHVALLGGELETALAAYREAAGLVPDRPLPHASIGSVLQQLRRRDEALAAFDQALALAPDDEAALAGRAALLADPGFKVAEGTPSAGVEPTPAVASEPVAGPADEPLAEAAPVAVVVAVADGAAVAEATPGPEPGPDASAAVLPEPAEPEAAPEPTPAPAAAAGPIVVAAREPHPEPEPVPPPVDPTAWPAIDLPSPPPPPLVGPPPDPAVLQAEAEVLIDAGDTRAARDVLLLSVAVHRAAGRLDAALDACLQLLTIVPGDPRVHLEIANLQLDRGWRNIATEKIELLLRLTSLSGDAQAEADVHLLAADRLRDVSGASLDARKRGVAAT